MKLTKVTVAGKELTAPAGHTYTHELPPTYDYEPWRIIFKILESVETENTLVDVGANIGDSAAHWRKYSESDVVCVEASPHFQKIVTENMEVLGGSVKLVPALVCPERHINKVAFYALQKTGLSKVGSATEDLYDGDYITVSQLTENIDTPVVFKTDTDGFDAEILESVVEAIGQQGIAKFPVLFAEGPTRDMMAEGDFTKFVEVFSTLQCLGYKLILLTNRGQLFTYCGSDRETMKFAFAAVEQSMRANRGFAEYLDAIFVSPEFDVAEKLRDCYATDQVIAA